MARLLVIGSTNADLTIHLPVLPRVGETVLGGTFSTAEGGKGGNQAVAAARAGAEVVFVSAVGDDLYGRAAREAYGREGIDVGHVRVDPAAATGVALIFVGERGENLIGVASGANASLPAGWIVGLPDALFPPGGVLLVAGLELNLSVTRAAVERARRAGMRVVVNPAPVASGRDVDAILGMCDLAIPNRAELGALAGLPVGTKEEVKAACEALRSRFPRPEWVVTLGDAGSYLSGRNGEEHVEAHEVAAVDTVGAGDAFVGALAAWLAEGATLREAVAWGMAAGAISVTRLGARGGSATRAEIEGFRAASRRV